MLEGYPGGVYGWLVGQCLIHLILTIACQAIYFALTAKDPPKGITRTQRGFKQFILQGTITMSYTLIELERTHKLPMVVRDAFNSEWLIVVSRSEPDSNFYQVKSGKPDTLETPLHEPLRTIYGGYSRWLYVGVPIAPDLSPAEQKRIREEERKQTNKRILDDLRRSKERKRNMTSSSSPKKPKGDGGAQVIPFKPKDR